MDGKTSAQNESPEQLLDVFKQAALSVTKLYKLSVAAETRAKAEGYQECLDDLLVFLERGGAKEPMAPRLRKWVAERRDGREATPQSTESEDETDKPEPASVPEPIPAPTNTASPAPQPANEESTTMITDDARSPEFIAPSRDNFTFQSDHPYPNIELLDLSDSRSHNNGNHHPSRQQRSRPCRNNLRGPAHLGRGAGAKRRMDFDDFFGGCFGGKDPFGGGGKRSRHS